MALFDFLKRKEEVKKAQQKKQPEKKADKVSVKKETKTEKTASASAKGSGPLRHSSSEASATKKGFSYSVIREPHISEKATDLSEENKYTFKIYDNANKPEIKKSVEGIYGVDVLDVNIIKIPKKKRRLGRTEGFKKGFKKAVVKIKAGQKIEEW